MKRPRQKTRFPDKPKSLDRTVAQAFLDRAAERASFMNSDYHCRGENGRPPATRTKPTMHCPRQWTIRQGINAVREAIRAGRVSRKWLPEGFPRHIWHLEGDVWYEARSTNGNPGEYHGYPIEASALPAGLER